MTHEELRQAAIDYLGRAFDPSRTAPTEAHVTAAAVTLTLNPIKTQSPKAQ